MAAAYSASPAPPHAFTHSLPVPAQVFLTDEDEYLVLVLELAAGGDLSAAVPPGRGLPEEDARWTFQQVAFALEYW